jgi:hypothetical protein
MKKNTRTLPLIWDNTSVLLLRSNFRTLPNLIYLRMVEFFSEKKGSRHY